MENPGRATLSVLVALALMSVGFTSPQPAPTASAPTLAVPSGIVAYVPITITNSQSTPTPSPFQQLVTINSSEYANLESPNLQNVGFFSSNGTMIPSWLESGNSSGSTDTVYWLNLRNPIFGGSKVTVYMGFASRESSLFNDRTTGEASQLIPGYGEYDDGAHVFLYYTDFAGSSLPTGWTSHASLHLTNVSYSVNNGLTLPSQLNCCGSIDYNKTYGSGTMIDVDATVTGQTGGNGEYGGIVGYRLLQERGQTYWGVAGRVSSVNYTLQTCYAGPCTYLVSNETYTSGTPVIGTIGFNGTHVVATNNYGAYVTMTPDLNAWPEAPTIQQGSSGLSLLIQWLRVRESPPNGVMPTVSLGSLYLSMTTTTTTTSVSPPTTTTVTTTTTSVSPTTTTATTAETTTQTVTSTRTSTTTATSTVATTGTTSLVPSQTLLTCDPGIVRLGGRTTCTADVMAPDGSNPTGTVSFSSSGQGSFSDLRCGVSYEDNDNNNSSLTCSVRYAPAEAGVQNITAAYPGDTLHSGSSWTFALKVVEGGGDDGGGGSSAAPSASATSSPSLSFAVPPAFAFVTLLTVVAFSLFSRVRAHRSRSAADDRLH